VGREGRRSLRTLADVRVGIVGLGRIGGAVATRLLAFGADVWAHDVLPGDARRGCALSISTSYLPHLTPSPCTFPLTRETCGLIGRPQLALMKHDALLVNTSRGAVVDVGAVLEALRAGRLGGAALDVFAAGAAAGRSARAESRADSARRLLQRSRRGTGGEAAVASVREILGA